MGVGIPLRGSPIVARRSAPDPLGVMINVLAILSFLALSASACATAPPTIVTVSTALKVEGDLNDRSLLLGSLEGFLASSSNQFERGLSGFVVEYIRKDEQTIMVSGCAKFGRLRPERYSAFVVAIAANSGLEWTGLNIAMKGTDSFPEPCEP